VPIYSLRDIKFFEFSWGGGTSKVLVDGRKKVAIVQILVPDKQAIERKFERLQTIANSSLPSSIRVPKLIGHVERAETEKIRWGLGRIHSSPSGQSVHFTRDGGGNLCYLGRAEKEVDCSDPRNC